MVIGWEENLYIIALFIVYYYKSLVNTTLLLFVAAEINFD